MRWLLLLVPLLLMAEPLTKRKVVELLDKQNPFVLLRTVQLLQSEAKKIEQNAPYDLRFDLKYEKKEYPLSRSLYMEGGVKRLFEKGVEVGVKWRKASGIQEYNNIKTGADGEYLAQIKLHLNALIEGMSEADIQKRLATLEVLRQNRLFRERINALLLEVLSLHTKAIGLGQKIKIVQERLKSVKSIQKLLQKKLNEGVVSQQDWLQVKEWALSQRQALVKLNASFTRTKRVLGLFLGLERFELPSYFESVTLPPVKKALKIAFQERGSIQELAIRAKQQELFYKEANLKRFGKLEASLFGVRDVAYEKSGAKGVVHFLFPLQRSSYKAKSELAAVGRLEVETRRVLLEKTIETNLLNHYGDLAALKKEESILSQRVRLLKEITRLEQQKLKEGVSDFFTFNQKMLLFYKAQEELLQLKERIVLKTLEIERGMGRIGRD